MKSKFKNLKIACLFLFIFSLVLIFVYVLSEHSIKGQISLINSTAMHHYNSFTNGLIELENYPDIKLNGENYIFGECHDCLNYTAYKGDSVKNDILICGTLKEIANGYWAIKIVDGKVESVWASNYPLKKEQLISYTTEELSNQLNIFEVIFGSFHLCSPKIIGYYYNS